jgi:hypothetical protein
MKRFSAFEDAALLRRIERLERAENDLQQRALARIAQVDAERRWLMSDPQYRHLSSTLVKVRDDLRETHEELVRRKASAIDSRLAAAT